MGEPGAEGTMMNGEPGVEGEGGGGLRAPLLPRGPVSEALRLLLDAEAEFLLLFELVLLASAFALALIASARASRAARPGRMLSKLAFARSAFMIDTGATGGGPRAGEGVRVVGAVGGRSAIFAFVPGGEIVFEGEMALEGEIVLVGEMMAGGTLMFGGPFMLGAGTPVGVAIAPIIGIAFATTKPAPEDVVDADAADAADARHGSTPIPLIGGEAYADPAPVMLVGDAYEYDALVVLIGDA